MKWRTLIESSALGQEATESGGIVFGEPATEAQIQLTETRLGVQFSEEIRELYREFNGAGLPFGEDQEIAWWIAPLELVEGNTGQVRAALDDSEDEDQQDLADRMVCFGDWMNGDFFGCVADPHGAVVSPEIYVFDHETKTIDPSGQTLEELLQVV